MPQLIPIETIPNQELSFSIGNVLFGIKLQATNGMMSATVSIGSVPVISGLHCVAYGPLIPSKYEENGNFLFTTSNNELPNYTKFNVTQNLIYFTPAELATYRQPPTFPITDDFFNPDGGLPLRYKPQNYTRG